MQDDHDDDDDDGYNDALQEDEKHRPWLPRLNLKQLQSDFDEIALKAETQFLWIHLRDLREVIRIK